MKICLLFPGQGSQSHSMLNSYQDKDYETIVNTYAHLEEILKIENLKEIITQNDPLLHQTTLTQPLILAHSLAIYKILKPALVSHNIVVAGHSLGELSAVSVSCQLQARRAIDIAHQRGKLMTESLAEKKVAMLVVLMEHNNLLTSSINKYKDVKIANYNSPNQQVLAGPVDEINALYDELKSEHQIKCIFIPMSVISHHPWLNGAVEPFEAILNNELKNKECVYEIYHAGNLTSSKSSVNLSHILAEALVSPVRFYELIKKIESNIDCFIEIGPGKILTGLIKRFSSKNCYSTSTSDDLCTVINLLANPDKDK